MLLGKIVGLVVAGSGCGCESGGSLVREDQVTEALVTMVYAARESVWDKCRKSECLQETLTECTPMD